MTQIPDSDDFLNSLRDGYQRADVPLNERLLLAVSGGVDSMAMLDATRRIVTAPAKTLIVAHLNHGLRPSSHEDQELVRHVADSLNVPFVTKTLHHSEIADAAGSIEEAARGRRYEFLTEAAKRHRATTIVTAHHLTDQAETIIHHIARGTGLRGLAGMLSSRVLHDDTRIVRPLLHVPRKEIEAFVSRHRLSFRQDETNADNAMTRNRIRSTVIPQLKSQIDQQTESHLVTLAEQASEAVQILDSLCEDTLQSSRIEIQANSVRLKRKPIERLPGPLRRHFFTVLWRYQDWPRKKMSRLHWQRAADAIDGKHASIDLPGNITISTTEQMVRCIRNGGS